MLIMPLVKQSLRQVSSMFGLLKYHTNTIITPMESRGQRISKLMKRESLETRDVVCALRVTKVAVGNWLNDRGHIAGHNLIKLAHLLDTTAEFIELGKDENMFSEDLLYDAALTVLDEIPAGVPNKDIAKLIVHAYYESKHSTNESNIGRSDTLDTKERILTTIRVYLRGFKFVNKAERPIK